MTSNDLDWRLTVEFKSKGHAHAVFSALKTHAASALAANRLKDGVVAQHDAQWLRIYAASYDALRRGQGTVAEVIEIEGVQAEERAEHRVGDQATWTAIELPPVPDEETDLLTPHRGRGPWGSEADPNRVQVHFELASKDQAQQFAKELVEDGYDVHHAGTFVFVFADDDAAARQLGDALKERAPADARLFIEGEGNTIVI